MKTTRYFLCVFLFVFSGAIQLFAQHLEIHQLNVDQADAAVVLTRGKDSQIHKIMIIDFGDGHRFDVVGGYVRDIIKYKGDIDCAIVSHYDTDHYAGFTEFIRQYLEPNKKKIKLLIIPGGFGSKLEYPQYGLSATEDNKDPALPPARLAANELKAFVTNISNPNYVSAVLQVNEIKKIPDADFVFDIIDGVPVNMELVAALQYVRSIDKRVFSKKGNYNDDGLAWVLHFGQFRFYTGGDLGGGGAYIDHETPLAAYFASNAAYNAISLSGNNKLYKGHVCVAKLNHHGSKESSNSTFLNTTNASAWLISCGQNSSFNHPNEETLVRMLKTTPPINDMNIRGIFITSLPYNEDTLKVTKRFRKKGFWLAYNQSQMHKINNPIPFGTYKIIVEPKNYVDVNDIVEEERSIKQNSVFTVVDYDPNTSKERFSVFSCHHIK